MIHGLLLLLVQSVMIIQYVPPAGLLNMKIQQPSARCATEIHT
jgi:hypothetical protein